MEIKPNENILDEFEVDIDEKYYYVKEEVEIYLHQYIHEGIQAALKQWFKETPFKVDLQLNTEKEGNLEVEVYEADSFETLFAIDLEALLKDFTKEGWYYDEQKLEKLTRLAKAIDTTIETIKAREGE